MKSSVRETIDALGGQAAVSRLCGMSRTAVRNWYKNNAVPHWQQPTFDKLTASIKVKKKAA